MTKKADVVIQQQISAKQKATAMADEMKGKFMKNIDTGSIFHWTVNGSLLPFMRVLTDQEEAEYLEANAPKTETKAVVDEFTDMDEDALRTYAGEKNVALGNLKDLDKIRQKLRAA